MRSELHSTACTVSTLSRARKGATGRIGNVETIQPVTGLRGFASIEMNLAAGILNRARHECERLAVIL